MQKSYQAKHAYHGHFMHQKIFLAIVVLIIFGTLFGLLLLNRWQKAGRPDTQEYPVLGVSLSQEDGYQDFRLLKKHGVDFVYLKATQGADYFDDNFLSNYWRIQGAQLPFGVYHYFSFTSSPQAQFDNFKTSIGQQIGNLPIVIQLNDYQNPHPTTKKIRQSVSQLRTLLVNYYQRKVIIQTTPTFAKIFNNPKDTVWLQSPKLPLHKRQDIDFWEYIQQGKIPSLASTNLYHMSVFIGNENHWQHYVQTGGY